MGYDTGGNYSSGMFSWDVGNRPISASQNKNALETQLMQAEINRITNEEANRKNQATVAAKLTSQFLSQWNNTMAESKGMFNRAIAASDQSMGLINRAYGDVGKLDDILNQAVSEYNSFKSQYGGLEADAIAAAREGFAAERELTGTILDQTRPDYEGVAGRAKADVGASMEKARRAEAIRMQGLGIDPTSGAGRGNERRNRVDTAIGKALAGNKARLDEKMRVGNFAIAGMNAIDPTRAAGVASGISGTKANMLGQQGALATAGVNARTNLANSASNVSRGMSEIGGSYARNISQPYGEMFATQLGTAMSNNAGALAPNMNKTVPNSMWITG